jgi:hypothetical protein
MSDVNLESKSQSLIDRVDTLDFIHNLVKSQYSDMQLPKKAIRKFVQNRYKELSEDEKNNDLEAMKIHRGY